MNCFPWPRLARIVPLVFVAGIFAEGHVGHAARGAMSQESLPSDTVANWTLDETSGLTANDASGQGNHGTLVNGPVWSSGRIGGALTFDGADDHVVVNTPTQSLKPSNGYAISAWVKYTATDSNGGDVATMGDSYALRVQPNGEVKTFFYDGSGWRTHTTSGVNTKTGLWHHLVGQYTGSTVEVYVDGVYKQGTPYTGAIAYTLGTSFSLGRQGSGGVNHHFNGSIDAVRVYGRSLTAAEIAKLAAEPPMAFWKLDETSGTTASDASGQGNHGTLMNGPVWSGGKIGGALTFDGADDHVVVNAPTQSLKPSNGYAISAWVKYTATDTNGGEVATMGDSYALRVQPNGDVKTFFYDGTGWRTHTTSGVNTKNGQWRHLVGQYTGSSVEVYVDGIYKQGTPYTGAIAYTLGTSFSIGRQGNGGVNHHFNGSIDEVRVYGRALTVSEIFALAQEAPAEPSSTVSVLTWNIHKCRGNDLVKNCGRVADTISTINPDIALLSAVYDQDDANAIKAALGEAWNLYYDKAPGGGEGQAILAKAHAISVTDSEVVSVAGVEDQIIIKATVTVNGRNLSVFAIDQDWQNAGARWEQAKAFSVFASRFDEPRIVGGDFNEASGNAMTEWLTTKNYFEGWDSASPKVGYPTNEGTGSGRTKRTRLDHILLSKGAPAAAIGEAKVWDLRAPGTTCNQVTDKLGACDATCSCQYLDDTGVRGSDHIPVTVKFTFGSGGS